MSDFVTGFYTKDGVKKYDYNALANLPESGTDITNTVISPNADYAEVGEWSDGNPDGENRLGYFVSIAEVGDNTIKIRKATSEDDVRGVSVYNPAFSGNASKDKYGADGELLPQYNYIGVMGIVQTIDNGRCAVGGRCMPDDEGTAIPSTNNMGYAVLERVDSRHVLIAVEPGADMIQRVKTAVNNIEKQLEESEDCVSPTVTVEKIEGGHRVTITDKDGDKPFDVMNGTGGGSGDGLTADQLANFTEMWNWYSEQTYENMTLTITPTGKTYELGSSNTFSLGWEFSQDVKSVIIEKTGPTIDGTETETPTASKKSSVSITVEYKPEEPANGKFEYKVIGTRDGGKEESKDAKCIINFHNRFYYGYAADTRSSITDNLSGDFVKNLAKTGSGGFSSGRSNSFDVTCDAGTYIWFAYPKRFKLASTSMAPLGSSMYFNGGFENPVEASVTNGSNYTETYYVYRSINPGISQSIKVT